MLFVSCFFLNKKKIYYLNHLLHQIPHAGWAVEKQVQQLGVLLIVAVQHSVADLHSVQGLELVQVQADYPEVNPHLLGSPELKLSYCLQSMESKFISLFLPENNNALSKIKWNAAFLVTFLNVITRNKCNHNSAQEQ